MTDKIEEKKEIFNQILKECNNIRDKKIIILSVWKMQNKYKKLGRRKRKFKNKKTFYAC